MELDRIRFAYYNLNTSIGSVNGYLYAIDIKTGLEKWKFETYGNILSSPVISEGVVYIGSHDSYLYALK
ncbi:MAG: PQQ-binding-like beta-propeller repeat protein [Clostridia bacterium]|nr:PQQ-binding-like beta-propeller repeat protein [Clostridia bacterium]